MSSSHARALVSAAGLSPVTPADRGSSVGLTPEPRRKVLRPEHMLAAKVVRAAVLDCKLSQRSVAHRMRTSEGKLRGIMAGEQSAGLHLVVAGPVDVEAAVGSFLVKPSPGNDVAQLWLPGVE